MSTNPKWWRVSVILSVLFLVKSSDCTENDEDYDCDCDGGSLYTIAGTLNIQPSRDNKGKLSIKGTHTSTFENHSPDKRPIDCDETVLLGYLSNVFDKGANVSFISVNKHTLFLDNTEYKFQEYQPPLYNFTNNVPVQYESRYGGKGVFTAVLTHTAPKEDCDESEQCCCQCVDIDAEVTGSAIDVLENVLNKNTTFDYETTSKTTLHVDKYCPNEADYEDGCADIITDKYVVQTAFFWADTKFSLQIPVSS